MRAADAQGEVALMLFESLLHVLVEEGIVSKEKALEAIEGVAELAREIDERKRGTAKSWSAGRDATALLQTLVESFTAKSQIPAPRRQDAATEDSENGSDPDPRQG
jgi:hypothetical protein